jgi:hypothetical protein
LHLSVVGGPIYGAGDGVEMETSRSLNELRVCVARSRHTNPVGLNAGVGVGHYGVFSLGLG